MTTEAVNVGEPKIGDYVIAGDSGIKTSFRKYVQTIIGKLFDITDTGIIVECDNPPPDDQSALGFYKGKYRMHDNLELPTEKPVNPDKYYFYMGKFIKYWSENKEDLIERLRANKAGLWDLKTEALEPNQYIIETNLDGICDAFNVESLEEYYDNENLRGAALTIKEIGEDKYQIIVEKEPIKNDVIYYLQGGYDFHDVEVYDDMPSPFKEEYILLSDDDKGITDFIYTNYSDPLAFLLDEKGAKTNEKGKFVYFMGKLTQEIISDIKEDIFNSLCDKLDKDPSLILDVIDGEQFEVDDFEWDMTGSFDFCKDKLLAKYGDYYNGMKRGDNVGLWGLKTESTTFTDVKNEFFTKVTVEEMLTIVINVLRNSFIWHPLDDPEFVLLDEGFVRFKVNKKSNNLQLPIRYIYYYVDKWNGKNTPLSNDWDLCETLIVYPTKELKENYEHLIERMFYYLGKISYQEQEIQTSNLVDEHIAKILIENSGNLPSWTTRSDKAGLWSMEVEKFTDWKGGSK